MKIPGKMKSIQVKKLEVLFGEAQRPLGVKHAERIGDHFNEDLFSTPTVTLANKDGVHHIIDGQTRIAAVTETFGQDACVPCRVVDIDPTSPKAAKEAAKVFDGINSSESRRNPTPLDVFRVRVTGGFPDETSIDLIVRQEGFKVKAQASDGYTRAVGALLKAYKSGGPDVLRRTLQIIRGTWGLSYQGVSAIPINGIALFVTRRPKIDDQRLIEKLGMAYTPTSFMGAVRNHKQFANVTNNSEAAYQILSKTYDANRRGRHKDMEVREAS